MADTKKLDKWAELLLDTGKRNNLINFKDAKTSTAEVVLPSPDAVFKRVSESASLKVFDPKIVNENDDAESTSNQEQEKLDTQERAGASSRKAAFLAQYAKRIKRQDQVLVYSAATSPLAAIKSIDKKAREFIEETGVNVAYMAFGFIHWKESESSQTFFRAPILLAPVQLKQTSAIEPYIIEPTEDDIIVNPTFAYKAEAEYGIKLPEYSDEELTTYLKKIERIAAKLQWEVSPECKIGIFSFLKINMYRDLKDNAKAILANKNVRRLLGEPIGAEYALDNQSTKPLANPLIELHNVIDADSSQISAIEAAKSGKSFVLQGPPGTGKSQTITNIIAECLSDRKKVLFVSEKLAALNVVYNKLEQAGLAEFCLQLHSHKANKKDVIADITNTLRLRKSALSSRADAEIASKEKAQRQLDAYATELHEQHPTIEKSLYELYETHAALHAMPDVQWAIPRLSSKGTAYLEETTSLLEQYAEYVPSIGYDYKKNPWYGYINQDATYQAKAELQNNFSAATQLLSKLIPLQKELSEKYEIHCASLSDAHLWNSFFKFAATSQLITPAFLNKKRFDKAREALLALQAQSASILAHRAALDALFDADIYKLDGATCYKKLTKQFSGTFSRLFNGEYKQLIASLRLCKKDGRKPSYDEAVSAAEQLCSYQTQSKKYTEAEAAIKAFLGKAYAGVESDWNYINEQMDSLETLFSHGISFGELQHCGDFASKQAAFAKDSENLESVFTTCDTETLNRISQCFDTAILDVYAAPCTSVLERLNGCLGEMDKLDNWHHFRNLLSALNDKQVVPFIDAAISQNTETKYIAGAFQKQFYYQWIDSIVSASPVLSTFNRISQDKAVETFSEKDIEQLEINKARIRAELSSMRPSLDGIIAPGSALSVLLRESEKKRKQKSIRSLLTETGELVQRIKPCFLMSPLSVSTFLAPGSVHFDVVIFDEASQIFPQDAIGAICRGKQLIVVGDSKQMPPSNFFNASIEAEDNDEETGDVTDFESILDLCSTSMQQLRLCWHYRSRYEQLIAFSNKNFYDGDLVTFPSSKADAPGIGVDYFHVDGVFDRKTHTNRQEAEFVVDLIYRNIEKYPGRSLGVVAFSIAQQKLIDKLLSKRRQNEPEKESFFKNDKVEPFFIKNLETVQGDERDTIIFSIAYGIDAQGRLLHNFGPLNRLGGERRLNVAITRAKCNVQLVSSMRCTDIDLARTAAEGSKLLREYLDYAENGSIALERNAAVNPFEQFDSDFELEVYDFLKSKGFSVDTQVGCSGFRIDLGLKKPNSSDYVLAIECDGATYHSSKNARDRDRLRQEILERMGWKFYRIWSTDWFRNKTVEQTRLLEAAANATKNPATPAPLASPNSMSTSSRKMKIDRETANAQGTISSKETTGSWKAPACQETANSQSPESFEEVISEQRFAFPQYKTVDIRTLSKQYLRRHGFIETIKTVLKTEAPLSEEWLLKRIAWLFGREKATKVVRESYEQNMRGYLQYGIYRKNGFLYLRGEKIRFRAPGETKKDKRPVDYIAPEELAAGMLVILEQNVTANKDGLYRSLAEQCGVSRLGSAITERMDASLAILQKKGYVTIDGEQVSLKKNLTPIKSK